MNYFFLVFLMAFLLLLPSVCKAESRPLTIVHVTDLHYISPALTDRGAAFRKVISNADGKVMLYSEELLNAFLSEMQELQPDAIIISGDLTFNGETESHKALASYLKHLQDEGIHVLVIPGNHDLSYPHAARFSGNHAEHVDSPNNTEFYEIWHSFGPDQSISRDPNSFSYTYALSPKVRVLMLDSHTDLADNLITDTTLLWAKEQLRDAKEAGALVISVTHETLLRHNPVFEQGFRLANGETVAALLEKSGVLLHLSGHMHIQHITCEKGLTEIVTSSLSVQPCQYGILSFDGESLRYQSHPTDVSAWAKSQGLTESDLLRFPSYAASFFASSTLRKAIPKLNSVSNAKEAIIWMANVNIGYFSGRLSSLKINPSALVLLREHLPFWFVYFDSIRKDLGKDYTRWSLVLHKTKNQE